MGLDMYAYSVPEKEAIDDFSFDRDSPNVKRIAYWRKHHDLHGWMARLWINKFSVAASLRAGVDALFGRSAETVCEDDFNCVPVRLTLEDLEQLEIDVCEGNLPATEGFFFGNNPPDEETKEEDLAFIRNAISLIKSGHAVYYNSWW